MLAGAIGTVRIVHAGAPAVALLAVATALAGHLLAQLRTGAAALLLTAAADRLATARATARRPGAARPA